MGKRQSTIESNYFRVAAAISTLIASLSSIKEIRPTFFGSFGPEFFPLKATSLPSGSSLEGDLPNTLSRNAERIANLLKSFPRLKTFDNQANPVRVCSIGMVGFNPELPSDTSDMEAGISSNAGNFHIICTTPNSQTNQVFKIAHAARRKYRSSFSSLSRRGLL